MEDVDLKQWMIKYYKLDSDLFRRAMGVIGTVTNRENQNSLNKFILHVLNFER